MYSDLARRSARLLLDGLHVSVFSSEFSIATNSLFQIQRSLLHFYIFLANARYAALLPADGPPSMEGGQDYS